MICQLVRSPPAVEVVFWIPGSPDVGTGEMAAKKARTGFGAASLEWGDCDNFRWYRRISKNLCISFWGSGVHDGCMAIIQCQVALGSKETGSCRGF